MAIISSTLIIRTLSLVRLYAAYVLLTQPSSLPTGYFPQMLGSSMRLPTGSTAASAFPSTPTPATAFAALALALLGASDLAATGLAPFAYDEYWGLQTLLRTMLFLVLAGWIYITGPSGSVWGSEVTRKWAGKGGLREGLEGCRNGMVFTWAFLELCAMFWVNAILREERTQRARELLAKRQVEEERRTL